MILHLINLPFYTPLSFEFGVASGAVSIIFSQIGYKLYTIFVKDPNSIASLYLFRTIQFFVKPIYCLEELIKDKVHNEAVLSLFLIILALTCGLLFYYYKLQQTNKQLQQSKTNLNDEKLKRLDIFEDNQQHERLRLKAQLLQKQNNSFIEKVDKLEKLNKKYKNAVDIAEYTYKQ